MQSIEQEMEQNEFVKLMLDSIGEGVFILNTEGTIIGWNPAMTRITGYSSAEMIGESCETLKFDRCFHRVRPIGMHDCGIMRYGSVELAECLLTHKDGHSVSITKTARVIKNKQDKIIGIIETITDLTELKNNRLQMERATRRLVELNQVIGIIGMSEVMQNVFSFIKASAASDATILIQGESGTGKELVAHAIHSIGERRHRPLVTINCSALSESLLESELFGHVKGAFTGAAQDRIGRFEQAHGGTIFLDEIGEISPYIQIKLLRVLQQREVERVGESRKRKIDIRVITATNKDLKSLVEKEIFREDLYYRLKVFPIYMPPLRNRKDDIPLLVNHFIELNNKKKSEKVKGISQAALKLFIDYSWPGNVRELANAIEHAFVVCSGRNIEAIDIPIEISEAATGGKPVRMSGTADTNTGKDCQPRRLTREGLVELLKTCGWNKAEVARRTGLSRASIWKYMKKWGIPMQP